MFFKNHAEGLDKLIPQGIGRCIVGEYVLKDFNLRHPIKFVGRHFVEQIHPFPTVEQKIESSIFQPLVSHNSAEAGDPLEWRRA